MAHRIASLLTSIGLPYAGPILASSSTGTDFLPGTQDGHFTVGLSCHT
jgi:hypothetical protein